MVPLKKLVEWAVAFAIPLLIMGFILIEAAK